MKELKLTTTKTLMESKAENKEFDSYAVYVKIGEYESSFFSKNVNEDTYFDLASCGKVLVTSPLILQAVGKGLLSLESTIGEFFGNASEEKKSITVKQLLTHTSGIIRINLSAGVAKQGNDAVAKEILEAPLAFIPGSDYAYSCNGMILLGFILEKIYGKSLENIFEEHLKKPLGYTRSKFNIYV